MKRVTLEEFRKNARGFIKRCRRMREPIAITESGEEIARLVPGRRSLREWIREALGFFRQQTKATRKYAYWGVYLKLR